MTNSNHSYTMQNNILMRGTMAEARTYASTTKGAKKSYHQQEKEGGKVMKKLINLLLTGVFLVASLSVAFVSHAQEGKMMVLNPLGTPPPIPRVPMAPRLDSLTGKTVYIVDTQFPGTKQFLEEMQKLLSQKYPNVNWVLRDKRGSYFDDDPKLWAEIKEKGHAAVMAIGH